VGKLPRPSGKDVVRFLERQGFIVLRVRGSHHFLDRGDQRTSVPVHGNSPLKIGTLRGILRDIDMSPSDFERLWGEG
jgi:predicted RNA binding protein YcfA (HicA-like mRNA interferase family)